MKEGQRSLEHPLKILEQLLLDLKASLLESPSAGKPFSPSSSQQSLELLLPVPSLSLSKVS